MCESPAMRILHIFDHSLPLQSGYVYRSLGILGAQRGFGWETAHLTAPRFNRDEPAVETVDGWEFHRTPKPKGTWPVAREVLEMRAVLRRARELIRLFGPDIVHAHSPALVGLPACRAAASLDLPFVYEVRALWEDAAVTQGTTREWGPRYRLVRRLETAVLRRADAVVTLCGGMKGEIASRGVPEAKITVVPNAVDLAAFDRPSSPDPELAQQLGIAGATVLGFIGSFYHYEGLDLLIRALPLIQRTLPQTRLLLVGGGDEEEALRRQVAAMGLSDSVRLTGRVPHGEVKRYYDLIDFFVYPRRRSRLTDLVTPLKPLEAMAARRLVIASSVGAHLELIRDNETGYLFDPDDAASLARRVVAAIGDGPPRHQQIRQNARDFVEAGRTWPKSAAHYQPLYHSLARRRPARS
ncbi:MAG TPA: TIGR04063 family PEP-CTERM/XrtA system glycosyltransferase [Stellaceae bacterium]|nr:TIGR04063 family PEP-CTERM/XrtA system glycosyltransferase [Stellaceae bacterium]